MILTLLTQKMGYLHPSWNTDQGVKQARKRFVIYYISRTERESARTHGVHKFAQHRPALRRWVRVCLFGPERWCMESFPDTIHEQNNVTHSFYVHLSLFFLFHYLHRNYAWQRWSLEKLRWKPVAILTCKSFALVGYRSERLIEPPSSWFTSKFPSG